ncbi:circumsporozoite protein-like [Musca vetustissima]|uniref:circumsporozoite protein-like n=1 Tax=Musca vetustissima TaxID=27455 RepID=UPI002AB650F2|nr:circumsporozoite protein-like [Musca vetustissima]
MIAQNSIYGWYIYGPIAYDSMALATVEVSSKRKKGDIGVLLRKFWEQEEVERAPIPTVEDEYCEDFYKKTTCRRPDDNRVRNCNAVGNCRICRERHHTLLHPNNQRQFDNKHQQPQRFSNKPAQKPNNNQPQQPKGNLPQRNNNNRFTHRNNPPQRSSNPPKRPNNNPPQRSSNPPQRPNNNNNPPSEAKQQQEPPSETKQTPHNDQKTQPLRRPKPNNNKNLP